MDIADFHFFKGIATVVFDDLHMSRTPGNAETGLGLRAAHALARWIVSITEYLREQGAVRGQAISEQGYRLRITHPRGPLLEQAADQGFIPCALHMGQNELARGVHQFRFPGWLLLATGKTMPFICLQLGNSHVVHFLLMILLPMSAHLLVQPPHGTGVDFHQARRALEAQPSARCLATETAFASGILLFHKAVFLRSLNSC